MDLDLNNYAQWEIAQKITVKFLKDILKTNEALEEESELKAYLWVISDNMWIEDFKKYAKEKGYEKYCEEIYKNYNMD